ncbi:MAG: DsbA family protein [Clostridium butyricum]|nr:DsbA family protein [Clostridium butyricum]
MSLKIKVYSDYVCPFCFLAKFPFEEAIEGKDVEVEWMPYELRPEPTAPLDPVNDPSKLMLWEKYIYPTIDKLNINMKLPNVSPHPYTGLAFQGYHYAKENGKGKEYNDRVFKALFQEEKNIGKIHILKELAKEIGIDENDFEKALLSGKYKEVQNKALNHAYNEANISAVPTFMIGDKVMSGFNNKEDFESVINGELENKTENTGLVCSIDGVCE